MNVATVHIAQWTTGSTARLTYLQFGFVPDMVRLLLNHEATNPSELIWVNKATYSQWLDADDHLLITGSSGVITRVTSGIAAYDGNELIAADETINSNPVHPFTNGGFPKAGMITAGGISIPAASLTANGRNFCFAYRQVPDQRVSGLVV